MFITVLHNRPACNPFEDMAPQGPDHLKGVELRVSAVKLPYLLVEAVQPPYWHGSLVVDDQCVRLNEASNAVCTCRIDIKTCA